MLVLTRKSGETILLGDDIEIRVLGVDGDQVKIGIVAPRSVNIVRGELLEDIRKETASASVKDIPDLKGLSQKVLRLNVPVVTPSKS